MLIFWDDRIGRSGANWQRGWYIEAVDARGGPQAVTLPDPFGMIVTAYADAGIRVIVVTVKDLYGASLANPITVSPLNPAHKIDGAASYVLSAAGMPAVTLVWLDGLGTWIVT